MIGVVYIWCLKAVKNFIWRVCRGVCLIRCDLVEHSEEPQPSHLGEPFGVAPSDFYACCTLKSELENSLDAGPAAAEQPSTS